MVVVGGGPVGLLLAGELRLGGAAVVVLEQLAAPMTESRATTLHARTMELLDSRSLLAALGTPPRLPRGHFGGLPLDLDLPSRYPGQWKVPQARTEALLGDWAVGLGADLRRGWRVTALLQDDRGVEVTADTPTGPRRLRAAYVVGCDGEQSTVRRLAEIPSSGAPARRELLRADVRGVEIPDRRFERLEQGLAIASRGPDGVTRVMVHEYGRTVRPRSGPPEFTEVLDVWKRVTGEDLSHGEPLWLNAFGDVDLQADHYRAGRVLLAGDAAHQQLPSGGQALNLGLQDAFNLGWKLALEVGPHRPADLLDSYHRERHAVGARVLANIRAQAALLLGGPETQPLRALLAAWTDDEQVRRRLAGTISGLDVHHPAPAGAGVAAEPDALLSDGALPPVADTAFVGARLPELRWAARNGEVSTTELLHAGRGLLLDFSGAGPDGPLGWLARAWASRVTTVRGGLPAAGSGLGAAALVRPDGHLAWTGASPTEAAQALRTWFGPPDQGL